MRRRICTIGWLKSDMLQKMDTCRCVRAPNRRKNVFLKGAWRIPTNFLSTKTTTSGAPCKMAFTRPWCRGSFGSTHQFTETLSRAPKLGSVQKPMLWILVRRREKRERRMEERCFLIEYARRRCFLRKRRISLLTIRFSKNFTESQRRW